MEYGTITRTEDEEGPVFQLRVNMAEAEELSRQIRKPSLPWGNPLLENLGEALNRFVKAQREGGR